MTYTQPSEFVFKIAHVRWREWTRPDVLASLVNCLNAKPAWSARQLATEVSNHTGKIIQYAGIVSTVARLIETTWLVQVGRGEQLRHHDIPPDCRANLLKASAHFPAALLACVPLDARTAFINEDKTLPSDVANRAIKDRRRQCVLDAYLVKSTAGSQESHVVAIAESLDLIPRTVKQELSKAVSAGVKLTTHYGGFQPAP